jgi:hypothetical protein
MTSILTLNVINCGAPLNTDFISFTAMPEGNNVKLNWTTNKEEEGVQYVIEKSSDGRNFTTVSTIYGYNNNSEVNYYNWSELSSNQTAYYRIRLIASQRQKISRIIKLSSNNKDVELNVPNPFSNKLIAQINITESQLVHLNLIDNSGRVIRNQQFALTNGTNNLQLNDTGNLPKGLYTLQIQFNDQIISRKLIKQ